MDIRERIRAIRHDKRLSQAELARRVGVKPTNYLQLEKRGNGISYEQLEKFAAAFEMSVVELLTYGEDLPDRQRVRELEKEKEEIQKQRDTLQKRIDRIDAYSDFVKSQKKVEKEDKPMGALGRKVGEIAKLITRRQHEDFENFINGRTSQKSPPEDTPNGRGHTGNGAQEPDIGVEEEGNLPGRVTPRGRTARKSESNGL